jgi:outer membrane protein assembly factor BamB
MPTAPTPRLGRIRLATLLCPPAGLFLLWREPGLTLTRRLAGSLFALLYCIPYAALWVVLLLRFTPLEVEWRGGFPPVLTFHKTKPDYDAVETDRARQAPASPTVRPDAAPPPYWTDFRGPRRDGHYTEQPIATDWAARPPRLLWKQPVGGGYASFVIAHGLAFTIEQRRAEECVTAYELETGREAWAHRYAARFDESMGGEGPRATPTWHDGRLYSLGAEGDLKCFDAASGKLLWERNALADTRSENLYYAMAASPLVAGELLIVTTGEPRASDGRAVIAYDRLSGEVRWQAVGDKAAYMSPMLVTLAGRPQLLVTLARRAAGLALEDGRELWTFPWQVSYDNNIAQPVLLGGNRLLLSAGYGKGCAAVEVQRQGDRLAASEVWRNRNLKTKFTSAVFHEGYLYGLDEDILVCLDATTGERRWKNGRYGYGQLLLASGQLLILCGDGDLALVRAMPQRHEERGRFPALKGKTWNQPALAHGRLLIRNAVEMACYDLR